MSYLVLQKDVDLFELQSRQSFKAEKGILKFPGEKAVSLKTQRVRDLFEDLVREGVTFPRLARLARRIEQDSQMEDHLDKILAYDLRLLGTIEDLEKAADAFTTATQESGKNPLAPEAPWTFEGLFLEYQKFGTEELQLLMAIILDQKSGGLGYQLKRKGLSGSRWDIDHKAKTIYLPRNDFGQLWSLRSNQSAAETLRTALHEEFKGEESVGSAIRRITHGTLLIVGGTADVVLGVGGLMIPEPFLTKAAGASLIALGGAAITEGTTQIFCPKNGYGFNPIEEGAAFVGKEVAGEKGESVARGTFQATNIIVSVGATVKVVSAMKTQAGLAKQLNQIQKNIQTQTKVVETVEQAPKAVSTVDKALQTESALSKSGVKTPPKLKTYPNKLAEWDKAHGVKQLSKTAREKFRLFIKKGNLVKADGELFDTAVAKSAWSGKGNAIFVMDAEGNLFASTTHVPGRFHHSSFTSGNRVAFAGELTVERGKILRISNRSGHYQPPPNTLSQFSKVLEESGVDTSKVKLFEQR